MGIFQKINQYLDEKEVKDREINAGALHYHEGERLTGKESGLFQKGWYSEQKKKLKAIQSEKRIKREMAKEALEAKAEAQRLKNKPKGSDSWG